MCLYLCTIFFSNILWSTVSNALDKSKNIPIKHFDCLLLRLLLHGVMTIYFQNRIACWVVTDVFLKISISYLFYHHFYIWVSLLIIYKKIIRSQRFIIMEIYFGPIFLATSFQRKCVRLFIHSLFKVKFDIFANISWAIYFKEINYKSFAPKREKGLCKTCESKTIISQIWKMFSDYGFVFRGSSWTYTGFFYLSQ